MKKILSLILSICMILGMCSPLCVNAASPAEPSLEWAEENGWEEKFGRYCKTIDHIKYELFYGMNVYDGKINSEPRWSISTLKSPDASGKVTIRSEIDGFPVTAIGMDTFRGNYNITECIIPEGVEYVGESAFHLAKNVTYISLPDTLKMIDGGAFYMAWNLKELVVPAGVTYLAKTAFSRNNSGDGIERVIFEGNAPEILYIGGNAGNTLVTVNGVEFYHMEGTTGWDAPCWAVLNPKVYVDSDEPEVPVKPEKIVLDKVSVELEKGKSVKVTATVFPENADEKEVNWKSADESIATVKDGIITGVAAGETKVTAHCGNSSVEVIVWVKKTEEANEPEINSNNIEKIFSDVKGGSWYIPYMQYTYDKELITGTGNLLKPEEGIRRAQFVTVMYRLAGKPQVEDISALEYFKDVKESSYYADAVCWAYTTGITTGNENTKCFNPNGSLTREQVATFIYRFFKQMGGSVENVEECKVNGINEVHSYAKEAVEWCLSMGIIAGKEVWNDGTCTLELAPKDGATRAQISKIIYSFNEKMDR